MKKSLLINLIYLNIFQIFGLISNDRISTLVQVTHSQWKTPWVELSIQEMPKFLQHEVINVKPILPSEEEGAKLIWNPDSDIKMSMTFSESKLVLPPFVLYNSKEQTYLNKLIIILEHDGYELVKVHSRVSYSKFNATFPQPFPVEYKWRGTRDEDRPLGVKTLFILGLVLFIGIVSVVYTIYDRDLPQPRKPSSSSGSTSYSGGSAGIHVKRRPSGGSYDKRSKY